MLARLSHLVVACASLLLLANACPARADLVVLVDDIERARITGPIGIGEFRTLQLPDIQIGDFALIRGLTVQAANEGGRSGRLDITIDSFTWGLGQPPPPDPPPTRVTIMSDFTLTTRLDVATVKLLSEEFTGTAVPPLNEPQSLRIDKMTEVDSLKLLLSDTITSSVPFSRSDASGTTDVPAEQLTLNFAKVEYEYTAKTGGESTNIEGFQGSDSWQFIPEPSALALAGIGALILLIYGWRQSFLRVANA
jgi:type VI protein secretion system component Hcp